MVFACVNQSRSFHRLALMVATVAVGALVAAHAENIVFPTDPYVKNVKTVYGAKGNGEADDTEPLRSAVKNLAGVIYFPNGTYRVTGSIICVGSIRGPWIYGQSRDGVVIKLDDGAGGFSDTANPRPVIAATDHLTGQSISADQYFRQWHNFTINAGNNPGAIGVRYYSNNSGTLHNVRIIGNGKYGLDMGWVDQNGPCFIQDVAIEGFATGVYVDNGLNSQTMSGITIRNCANLGIYARSQVLTIEDLVVDNTPTAIDAACVLSVINGTFVGTGANKPAIVNGGQLYCRGITTSRFSRAIQSSNGGVAGASVVEFTSESISAAFTNHRRGALGLPIKKTPPLQWEEDTSKWICVNNFGAVAGDALSDSKAFQDAIDTAAARGKTFVYVRPGKYLLSTNVYVHGPVRHIMGLGLDTIWSMNGGPYGFILREDAAPVVRFDNMYFNALDNRPTMRTVVSNNSSTLVVENSDGWLVQAAGSGDVFINNNCSQLLITNPAAHVWTRQWNTEGRAGPDSVDSDNRGASLWILGLKTEGGMMKIRTTNGGMTELFGAHIYNICTRSGAMSDPLFEIIDADASFACVREMCFCGNTYTMHVREKRGGTTMTWLDNVDRSWVLYSGADSLFAPPTTGLTQRAAPGPRFDVRTASRSWSAHAAMYDCRGARMPGVRVSHAARSPAGVYFVRTQTGAVKAVVPGMRTRD